MADLQPQGKPAVIAVDFEQLCNSDPVPSLLATAEGALVAANAPARRVLETPLPENLAAAAAGPADDVLGYLRDCARTDRPLTGVLRLRTADGEQSVRCTGAVARPASGSEPALIVLRFSDGAQKTFVELAEHISRLNAEIHAREEAERHLSLALTAARMGTWTWDRSTDRLTLSDRAAEIFGVKNGTHLRWADVEAVIGREESQHIRAAVLATLPAGGHFAVHYPIVCPNGTQIWVDVLGRARTSRDGRVQYTAGVVADMTERKHAEDRLRLLAAEVDHRAKNMLATMQAVVRMSRANTVQEFSEAITGRIFSLANTHTLIASSGWTGAELREILTHELAPYETSEPSRIRVAGPAVTLGPSSAQAFSMALHELATNAAKYGSLSRPKGRVAVEWTAAEGTLTLRWTETGGPPVTPPAHQGFGSRVIQGAIRQQLSGTVRYDWRPEGLHCELSGAIGRVYSKVMSEPAAG